MHEMYNKSIEYNHKSFTLHMPNLNQIESKLSSLKGFVKLSSNWSFVISNFKQISFFAHDHTKNNV